MKWNGEVWRGVERCEEVGRGVERWGQGWRGVERCGEVVRGVERYVYSLESSDIS